MNRYIGSILPNLSERTTKRKRKFPDPAGDVLVGIATDIEYHSEYNRPGMPCV